MTGRDAGLPRSTAAEDGTPLDRVNPVVLFLVSATSLYLGASLAVSLFDHIPPAGVAWWRLVGASVVLVVLRRPWRRSWSGRRVADAAAFGIALAAMNTLFYLSIGELPLGTAVAIEFIGPVAVGALGARTSRAWTSLALGAGGVALLAGIELSGSAAGVVFALAAAACWALYIPLGARVARNGDGLDGLALGTAIGTVVLAPLLWGPASAALGSWWWLASALAVGILSNAVPYGLDQVVLRRVTTHQFAVLLAILPAAATAIGALLLAQIPRPAELVGVVLVAVAVAVRE